MAVDIELFGQLLPDHPRRRMVEMKSPATVRDIASAIGLEPDEIGFISVDGVQSGLDDSVRSDSKVCIFPYITGG